MKTWNKTKFKFNNELVTVPSTKTGLGLGMVGGVACDLIGVHVASEIDGSASRVDAQSTC